MSFFVLSSVMHSLTQYFRQRAASAVLTSFSLDTHLALKSYLSKLLHLSTEPHHPFSAEVSVAVDPDINVHFVQSHPLPHAGEPVCSIIALTAFGLQLGSLLQSHSQAPVESNSTLSSLRLSLQGKCSSLKTSMAVKLGNKPSTSLPNLLANSSRVSSLIEPSPNVCVLLEAGCLSLSLTVAAKIVTMEVSPKAVLTWDHIQSVEVDESSGRVSLQHQTDEVRNQLAVSVSLPHVWADVAAPLSGWPSLATG